MQTPARIADARDQLPLDERVHVFVVAVDPRRIRAARLEDRLQAFLIALLPRLEHAGARERVRPRQAAGHIVFEQPPIERERHAEVERRGIGRRVEPSGP